MANVTYGGMVTQGNDLYQEYVVDGKSYWLKEGDPRASGFADWNEFAGTLTPDDMMAPEERTTPGGATPEPVVPVQPFGSRDVISLPGDWDPIQYLVNNPDVKAAGVDPASDVALPSRRHA